MNYRVREDVSYTGFVAHHEVIKTARGKVYTLQTHKTLKYSLLKRHFSAGDTLVLTGPMTLRMPLIRYGMITAVDGYSLRNGVSILVVVPATAHRTQSGLHHFPGRSRYPRRGIPPPS